MRRLSRLRRRPRRRRGRGVGHGAHEAAAARVRPRRRRLGARRRDEPVGRVRPGQGRARLSRRSSVTTTAARRSATAPTSILERVRVLVGDGLASVTSTNALAVFDGTGKRYVLPAGRGDDRAEAPAAGREERQAGRAPRSGDVPRCARVVPHRRRQALSRRPPRREARHATPARQRRRARGVPPRRRAGRDAEGLAARGAQGPGGRRADVRGGAYREAPGLRPLLGLAQPGLLRRRLGGAQARRER